MKPKTNKTGMKGVSLQAGRYVAHIRFNYVQHYLGRYDTPEEAHAAYVEAAHRLHGEFARTS